MKLLFWLILLEILANILFWKLFYPSEKFKACAESLSEISPLRLLELSIKLQFVSFSFKRCSKVISPHVLSWHYHSKCYGWKIPFAFFLECFISPLGVRCEAKLFIFASTHPITYIFLKLEPNSLWKLASLSSEYYRTLKINIHIIKFLNSIDLSSWKGLVLSEIFTEWSRANILTKGKIMTKNKSRWKMRGRLTGWLLFVKRSLLGAQWKLQMLLQAEKNRELFQIIKNVAWTQKLNHKERFHCLCFVWKQDFKRKIPFSLFKPQFNLNKYSSSWLHGRYIEKVSNIFHRSYDSYKFSQTEFAMKEMMTTQKHREFAIIYYFLNRC